jgi:transcriptional regulator with XRE-family HTH domain
MMKQEELLKRKNEMMRLKEKEFQFDEYQDYLPEAKDDIRLATHYKFRDLILDFKDARIKQNLTQADIAAKIGTKQTAVSRFESYDTKPTITFLMKYAKALGKDMVIQLENDFLIEMPQQVREKALKLQAEAKVNIKQILTEVLVNYVTTSYEPLLKVPVKSVKGQGHFKSNVINLSDIIQEAV